MKTMDVLTDFCASLATDIERFRMKANCATTSARDAHDLHTFVGGLEYAHEKARLYLMYTQEMAENK